MALDAVRAREVAQQFAQSLGISTTRLAEGIVQIANANMERAIRAVSVQRGYDPREFALLAFGGAGGMHACEVAESLEINTILIPEHAGVLSALGMLLADVRKDYTQTILRDAKELVVEDLEQFAAPMLERARLEIAAEGFAEDDMIIEPSLDVRYKGQAYEINVPLTAEFVDAFHQKHHQLYGHSNAARMTEVVNVRVNAAGITKKYGLPAAAAVARPLPAAVNARQAWFDGRFCETAVYHREDLKAGMEGVGPVIVSGGESTVVISPNFSFHIDGVGTLVATRIGRGEAAYPMEADGGRRDDRG